MRTTPLLLLSLVLTTLCAAAAEPEQKFYQSPSTLKMNERLRDVTAKGDPLKNQFRNTERAALLADQLAKAKENPEIFGLLLSTSIELLQSGQTEAALRQFGKFEEFIIENKQTSVANLLNLSRLRAITYLRLGEQENCLINHSAESCLLPIQGSAIHKLPRGSESAIQVLAEILQHMPDDLRARWLLNIAYMTLGKYPQEVPAQWLISTKVFESDYDIKKFPNIAAQVGLELEGLSGGCIAEDFNGDGNLDLMISSFGVNEQLRYFENDGTGGFKEKTKSCGIMGEIGGLNILQTDYNNDGFPDVLVLRGGWMGPEGKYPLSLLKNNGQGIFDDVTEESGLLSFGPSQTAVWLDFNNDGWMDLFVGYESSEGFSIPCKLFANNGDGTFVECAEKAGVANVGFVKNVTAGDYNNDGLPDLYLSRRDAPNVLYRNDGPRNAGQASKTDWKFTDVSIAAKVTEPIWSFPTWFFDYDNDGWLDIFVAGYRIQNVGDVAADYLGLSTSGEKARLFHNNHDGTFSDVTEAAHLNKVLHAMGSNFGDLDNDGFLDLYLGTGDPNLGTLIPNRMFRNFEGKFFQDVTTSGGFGHLQKGHGVAFADFDNDGDQDVYEVMGGAFTGDVARSVFFQNPGHGNHWITLKLEGVTSNRAAIGSRIKVTVATPTGPRSIHKTVGSGGSFGASPLRQEIGLGNALSIEAIEIFWPRTGKTQTFRNVAFDHFYKIKEGEPNVALWNLPSFELGKGESVPAHHHHQH